MILKNRNECIERALSEAEAICTKKNMRLTPLRRKFLQILLSSERPVKAYDFIEKMHESGERMAPTTVYRTLDFLQEAGLVHKIEFLDAFIPCTCSHSHHSMLLFICSGCNRVREIDDPQLYHSMERRLHELGLGMENSAVEIRGTCADCEQNRQEKSSQK